MERTTYLYIISAGRFENAPVKIGVADDVQQRLTELQCGNHEELYITAAIPCRSRRHAYGIETFLHKSFKKWRIRGEWFSSKCVSLIPERLDTWEQTNNCKAQLKKTRYDNKLENQELDIVYQASQHI